MGFYVDIAELQKAQEAYMKMVATAQSQLDTAKNGMNAIITSNSMYGEVGKAITNEINNVHNPVIVGLKNSLEFLGSEMKCSIAEAAFDIAARKAQKYLPGTDGLSFSLYGGKYFEDVLFQTFSPRCMSRKRVATPRHRRQQDARSRCKIFHVALALGRYIERYSLPLD